MEKKIKLSRHGLMVYLFVIHVFLGSLGILEKVLFKLNYTHNIFLFNLNMILYENIWSNVPSGQ